MRKFVLTSDKFCGSVTMWFDDADVMVHYNNETDMGKEAHFWMIERIPRNLLELELLKGKVKGKIEELPPDLSFETFWEAYRNKVNRKSCLALWEKMSKEKKIKCINSVKPYLDYLARVKWRNQKDPTTYLRTEDYETEWARKIN